MPMREFVDDTGTAWRVWSVAIDRAYGASARESYLGELRDGWLCFESSTERRRLARYPDDWHVLTDQQLAELLEQASPVPRRKSVSSEFELPDER